MSRVIVSALAHEDLLEIWAFWSEFAVSRAEDEVAKLDETFARLASHPRMGRARTDLPGAHLRSFPSRPYVVFYTPLERDEGITLVRVLHEKRDVTCALEDERG